MMTTTTEILTKDRVNELMTLSFGAGITEVTQLSEALVSAFNLKSDDPAEFASQLSAMREFLTPSDELEAAYYALGIAEHGDPDWRRKALLAERHGYSWDLSDSSLLKTQEIRGFYILASSYDLVMKFVKLAETAREVGRNILVSANVRKSLNTALGDQDPRA